MIIKKNVNSLRNIFKFEYSINPYILDETTVDKFYEFAVNVWDVEPTGNKFDVAKCVFLHFKQLSFQTRKYSVAKYGHKKSSH